MFHLDIRMRNIRSEYCAFQFFLENQEQNLKQHFLRKTVFFDKCKRIVEAYRNLYTIQVENTCRVFFVYKDFDYVAVLEMEK